MASVQITNRETLSHKVYSLKYFTYLKPDQDNKLTEKQSEVYYRPDAVAVLLHDKERNKLLLTRQLRLPTYLNGNDTGMLTETCAGIMDEGETPEQTAMREVMEETGYEIDVPERIGTVYTSPAGNTERIFLFTASYTPSMKTGTGGGLADEGESVESIELSTEEAMEMLKEQKIHDAKTVILLQHYFLFT